SPFDETIIHLFRCIIKIYCLKTASYLMVCSFFNPRQRIEGAKENTREQRGHIAPKRGAAADEHTRMHRAIPSPCKARTDQQAMIMLICAAECRS
ncbi:MULTISPECIES: hypothetical protein, partial [Enterobacteriaceae]